MPDTDTIETMTAEALRERLGALGWKAMHLRRALRRLGDWAPSQVTTSRWMTGDQPIPGWLPALLTLLEELPEERRDQLSRR